MSHSLQAKMQHAPPKGIPINQGNQRCPLGFIYDWNFHEIKIDYMTSRQLTLSKMGYSRPPNFLFTVPDAYSNIEFALAAGAIDLLDPLAIFAKPLA